ncbi:MAG TPA: response regulator [Clostridiaceae bacterium]|nr:response regulator [Clostridiaceae bacterium]
MNKKGDASLKALIIDDEAGAREYLKFIGKWERLGINIVLEAENGEDGLRKISEENPELIVTDMRMPVMDGIKLLEMIEQRALSAKILVISGYSDFTYTRRAIKSKVIDYLLKPVNPEEFNSSLKKAVDEIRSGLNVDGAGTVSLENLQADLDGRPTRGNEGLYRLMELVEYDQEREDFILLVTKVLNFEDIKRDCFNKSPGLFCYFIETKLNGIVFKSGKYLSTRDIDCVNEFVTILTFDKSKDQRIFCDIYEYCKLMLNEMENHSIKCNIGLSNRASNRTDFITAFEQAKTALSGANAIKDEKILYYNDNILENKTYSNLVINIMNFILENYYMKLSLDYISKMFFVSREHLCRIFKEETGENLFRFINRVRMEKARELLEDESLKICNIARMVGLEDNNYFTKVFKKHFGIPPQEYRNVKRKFKG